MKKMDSFYITLPSNVNNQEYDNTVANFKTNLAQKKFLKGDWEVGLAGISYTLSWYNLESDEYMNIINFDDNDGLISTAHVKIYRGRYETIEHLLTAIKYAIRKMRRFDSKKEILPEIDLEFTNHQRTRTLSYKFPTHRNKYIYLEFSQRLCDILGFNKEEIDNEWQKQMEIYEKDWEKDNTALSQVKIPVVHVRTGDPITVLQEKFYHAKSPYNVGHIFYGLFVYSDIVVATHVGDTMSQLLRFVEIPNGLSFGDQIVLSYPDTHYIPVGKKEIDSIEINIKDEYGNPFPFEFGRSIITLHFRQINKSQIIPNNYLY